MSNPLNISGDKAVLHLEVDRARDLAPQVIVLREIGIPWKLIELMAGRPKNRLEEQIATFAARLGGRANSPDTASLDLRQSPPPSRGRAARAASSSS